MASLVGQYQVTTFVSPVNGTSPIDANTVRGNDNTLKSAYDNHDSDATIHFQDSTLAARPAAGVVGRKWMSNDDYRIFYDDGSVWHEIAYYPVGGAISGPLNVTGDFSVATNKFTVASATGNTLVAGTLAVSGATTASAAITVAMAGANVVLNATSGNPQLIFQKAGVNTASWESSAASTVRLLDSGGSPVATFVAGALGLASVTATGAIAGGTTGGAHSTFASGVQVTGAPGSAVSGDIYKNATTGLEIISITGSGTDFLLRTPSGASILGVPTGTANVTMAGALAVAGAVTGVTTLAASGVVTASGLTVSTAVGKIIPGSTSISHRNNADSADNVLITDAGAVSVRSTLTVGAGAAANVVVAAGGAQLATNATVGFLMVSSMNGAPIGTPASIPTGTVPMVVNTSLNQVHFYIGGSWKVVGLS